MREGLWKMNEKKMQWAPGEEWENKAENEPEKEVQIPLASRRKKKRSFQPRQLALALTACVLGIAIYANWKYIETAAPSAEEESSSVKYYGQAELADTSVAEKKEDAILTAARTARRQQTDEERAELKSQAEDQKLPDEARNQAAKEMQELSEQLRLCSEMETRILAKGVADCMVYYDGGGAHVLVGSKNPLNADLVTAIRDVVIASTNLPATAITVAGVDASSEVSSVLYDGEEV